MEAIPPGAVVVDTETGKTVGERNGVLFPLEEGALSGIRNREIFRQHPLDYLEAIESCILEALKPLGPREREPGAGDWN